MASHISAITMPKWGIEMTEGTITGWRVKIGERIERGSEILDVETDKIVNAVEAPASGLLRRIIADTGDTLAVGALVGVIADEAVGDAEVARFVDSFVGAVVSFEPEADTPASTAPPAPAPSGVSHESGPAGEEARVSPIARRVAERLGVDLAQVTGTGRNGRISKEDVEAFAARGAGSAPTPVAAATPTSQRVRMSARRVTIARRLSESKQTIPHFRVDMEVDFGPLLRAKRDLAEVTGERGSPSTT
jgi:pyruvate dehydrogenase E2 component (dihydrolipoamide acetyltransferase)